MLECEYNDLDTPTTHGESSLGIDTRTCLKLTGWFGQMMGCLLVDCDSGTGVVGADRELREFLRSVRTNGRVTVMSIAQNQHGTQK
jgi:hypothetical protein